MPETAPNKNEEALDVSQLSDADLEAQVAETRARRAAQAAAEEAAKPAVEAASAEARRMLDSFDFSGSEQERRGDARK